MTDQTSLFGSENPAPARKQASPDGSGGEPLAARMCPRSLDEIVGQEHLLGPGHLLRRSIEGDAISSMILWGPPGSGKLDIGVDEDALQQIAIFANGDARAALNVLELAARNTSQKGGHVTLAEVEDAMQHRALLYDKGGDQHYDTISALHKSLRGSDPDAALYWLGRMIEAGEASLYIVRRLIRFASEDVGMADPSAMRQSSFSSIFGTVTSSAHRNGQSPCVG